MHSRCSVHICWALWSCLKGNWHFFSEFLKICLLFLPVISLGPGNYFVMRYALYNLRAYAYHSYSWSSAVIAAAVDSTPLLWLCFKYQVVLGLPVFCHYGIFKILLCLKSNYHLGTRIGLIIFLVLSCKHLKVYTYIIWGKLLAISQLGIQFFLKHVFHEPES